MKKIVAIMMAMIMVISVTVVLAGGADKDTQQSKVPVIIGFEGTPGPADKAIVRGHGGEIKHSYTIIDAIAAKLPEPAIENIQKNPRVTYVERDVEVHTLEDTLPWGVDRIDAELVWNGAEDGCDVIGGRNAGTGVKVAIIDTGIDDDHPDLSVVGGINYVVGSPFDDKFNDNWDDDNGHGTHCAGIVAALDNEMGVIGVAPEASLYAVKVLGSNGRGWTSDVIAGIEWATSPGMDVISMSLGGGYLLSMETACDNAYAAGIVLVAAAGNGGDGDSTTDEYSYPAAYDSVIAVGATNTDNVAPDWSNSGPYLELAAPGVSIYSTYMGGGYATYSGTSMACPHVAGTVALVIASDVSGAAAVRQQLTSTAEDIGADGWDSWYGHGLVDADEAAPSTGNQPPIADAGADQTVSDADGNGVEAVTLDGLGSYDPDGSIDTYEWKEGETSLSNTESFTRDFTVGEHTVTLTVTDVGVASSSDDVIVTVNANQPPVADAGADQTVSDADGNGVESVTLDGSGSSDPDPDGSIVSYEWKEGADVLSNAESFTGDFTVGAHTVTLTVTDVGEASSSDDVIVTVNTNQVPVADAGADQTASDADGDGVEAVTLDGSGSCDPDGSIDTYEWKEGADVLSNAESFTGDFTVGAHTVTLTVTDDGEASSSDDVIVSVTEAPTNTMHVASIDMSTGSRSAGPKNTFVWGVAAVTIVNNSGIPVDGATVSGQWSNATSDSDSGVTDGNGQISLKSDSVKNPSGGTEFTFTVDDVAKAGWTYNPSANEATSDSILVP